MKQNAVLMLFVERAPVETLSMELLQSESGISQWVMFPFCKGLCGLKIIENKLQIYIKNH